MFKAALRRVWRDQTTLQIGLQPDRALVLGGAHGAAAHLLAAIDGVRDHDELRVVAKDLGLSPLAADRLIELLVGAGVVDDAAAQAPVLAHLGHAERDRLAPDLASASITTRALDGGAAVLRRRGQARIAVLGAGRVGAAVASLLAAAGVGHLIVDDPAPCRPADCGPAGAARFDTGSSRGQAARAAVRRASGSTRTSQLPPTARIDLVVLAPVGALSPVVCEELIRADTPHLLAVVREATGIVGPFVVPGSSACLRCLDLHRADRDPAWPLIAAQLAADGPRDGGVQACDVVLATLTASVAALQALAWIDAASERRDPASLPPTVNGSLELTLPDWRMRRRSWAPHPLCGCRWPGAVQQDGVA